MTSEQARALVASTLAITGDYAQTYPYQAASFDSASPVATAHDKSLVVNDYDQGEAIEQGEVWVLLYVLCAVEGRAIDSAEVEATLSRLMRDATRKVRKAFLAADPALTMTMRPLDGGYQLIDGAIYRTGRFVVPFQTIFSEDF